MSYYLVKVVTTTALVILISEISKRTTFIGGILASVPLVSVLSMIWLYAETRNAGRVADLAGSIFWLVIPSLALFIVLPALIHRGFSFAASLAAGILITASCYYTMIAALGRLGIRL